MHERALPELQRCHLHIPASRGADAVQVSIRVKEMATDSLEPSGPLPPKILFPLSHLFPFLLWAHRHFVSTRILWRTEPHDAQL